MTKLVAVASVAALRTFEGFLRAEGPAPVDGLDRRADLLARTIRRAFENDQTLPDTELQHLAAAVIAGLTDLIDADRADIPVA